MDKDIEVYQESDILKDVKDKIRAEFVNLIPDEKWEALVKNAVDSWFEKKETRYNTTERVSHFDYFVNSLLQEECKERVKEYFNSPEWQGQWDGEGGLEPSDMMKKIIIENSPKIIEMIIGNAFQQAFSNAMQHIH